jgi:hypothetical protein
MVAPRVFAWAFEATVLWTDAMLTDWMKSDGVSMGMFLKLRYCSASLCDALFTEIPQAENASQVMMAAALIRKAIRARLCARQEFIDWRAAVVAFGWGRCGEQLRRNLDFEGHQLLIPSGFYDLDGILGRTVAEVRGAVAADARLTVVRAAQRLAVFDDFCGGPTVKYFTRSDFEFIGSLSVIFRAARCGGFEGMTTVGNDLACASLQGRTAARTRRLREEEGCKIRNLIASPNVRMDDLELGGLSLVPVPNSIVSGASYGVHAFEQELGGFSDRRQEHAYLVQDAYVEFVTLATIPSTNTFVRVERAKLRRILINEFSRAEHPRNLRVTDEGPRREYSFREVTRRVQALRVHRESLRPP